MKTLIPASIHFWQQLSWKARIVFIAFNLFVILLFIRLVLGIMDEAKARRHYRSLIESNAEAIEHICRNEPKLCSE